MKNDNHYMKMAIKEAKRSEKAGGDPIGAVIIKDGKVVATGWSVGVVESDPTSHAEVNCIRHASKKLKGLNLNDCTMYCTLEPCSMCLGAITWGEVSEVVFGAYNKDVMPENPNEIYRYSAVKRAHMLHPIHGGHVNVRGGVMRRECKALLEDYVGWNRVRHIIKNVIRNRI